MNLMTCSTSAVAVCRSSASVRSRVRLPTCFCKSVMDGVAVETLGALVLLARRLLTSCSLPPRRRISLPSDGSRPGPILCKSGVSCHGKRSGRAKFRLSQPVLACHLMSASRSKDQFRRTLRRSAARSRSHGCETRVYPLPLRERVVSGVSEKPGEGFNCRSAGPHPARISLCSFSPPSPARGEGKGSNLRVCVTPLFP